MDALEAIRSRRSIRRYSSEPVPEDTIRELLEAAMFAPSANNRQPWHFIVIDDRELLDRIPDVHPYAGIVRQVGVAILVCGDRKREEHLGYLALNCAAATQNLLLAARALGLGSVWLGVYPREERIAGLSKLLGLPDHVIPMALVPVGYPKEEKGAVERWDETKVSRNRW